MSSLLSAVKSTQEMNSTIPAHDTVLIVLDLDLEESCNQEIILCTAVDIDFGEFDDMLPALIQAFGPLFESFQDTFGRSIADGRYLVDSTVPNLPNLSGPPKNPNPCPLLSFGVYLLFASGNVGNLSGFKWEFL